MNSVQEKAVSLVNSPWTMDPITYELALQVLQDASEYYQLNAKEIESVRESVAELKKLYKYALDAYEPLPRKPRPQL